VGLSLRPKNCGFDDLTATAGEVIAPRSSGSSRRPRDQRSRAARRVLGILAGLAVGTEVDVSVQRTKHFRLPQDPDPPVIMVGPSTGIAPFRGFLYDRSERGHTGWQFFGERHEASKLYNRDELDAFRRSGVLTHLDAAFSRHGAGEVYVRDRMRENAADLWSASLMAPTCTCAATPPGCGHGIERRHPRR
jgi:ferredoxin-NADP reductase